MTEPKSAAGLIDHVLRKHEFYSQAECADIPGTIGADLIAVVLSYAAERERLLVSLDELIVRRLHRLSGSGPQFEHDCTLINGVHLRQTVRRSRPATEGKGDD